MEHNLQDVDSDVSSLINFLNLSPPSSSSSQIMQNINVLMNVTLNCLGTIRILTEKMTDSFKNESKLNLSNGTNESFLQLRSTILAFSNGVNNFMHHINLGEVPHNLDPSRHIIESFPNYKSFGTYEWQSAHWAILGDPSTNLSFKKKLETDDKINEERDRQSQSLLSCIDLQNHDYEIERNNSLDNIASSTLPELNSIVNFESRKDTYLPTLTQYNIQERISIIKNLPRLSSSHHPLLEIDKGERTVLHLASRLNSIELFDCVNQILNDLNEKKNKDESSELKLINIQTFNLNGALPLHNAARFCTTFPLFKHVYMCDPQLINYANNDRMLPLHWAAAKNKNINNIKLLLNSNKNSISMENIENCYPLHLAGQNNCLNVVKFIYYSYPEAISKPDKEGGFPLHHACSLNNNVEVVKFLYNLYPPAISISQDNGIKPIHLAASSNNSLSILKFLISLSPKSVNDEDIVGYTPLHCLLQRLKDENCKISLELIDCLRELLKYTEYKTSYLSFLPLCNTNKNLNEITSNSYLNLCTCNPPCSFFSKFNIIHRIFFKYFKNYENNNKILKEINWNARKYSIFLLIHMSNSNNIHSAINIKNVIESIQEKHFLLSFSLNNKDINSMINYHKKIENELNNLTILYKLCHYFMHPSSFTIPTGILQNIISFL